MTLPSWFLNDIFSWMIFITLGPTSIPKNVSLISKYLLLYMTRENLEIETINYLTDKKTLTNFQFNSSTRSEKTLKCLY